MKSKEASTCVFCGYMIECSGGRLLGFVLVAQWVCFGNCLGQDCTYLNFRSNCFLLIILLRLVRDHGLERKWSVCFRRSLGSRSVPGGTHYPWTELLPIGKSEKNMLFAEVNLNNVFVAEVFMVVSLPTRWGPIAEFSSRADFWLQENG